MDVFQIEDPFSVINYAYNHNYYKEPGFEWIKEYLEAENDMPQILKIFNTHNKNEKKFKFGVKVPKTRKEAQELDRIHGNSKWQHSIKLELDQIMSYKVFKVWPEGKPLPPG